MIESTFSYSSSWESESIHSLMELTCGELDDCLQDISRNCSTFSAFNDLSNSSSVCDDFTLSDFDDLLPVTDSLLTQVLEETNSVGLENNWSLLNDAHNYSQPVENESTSTKKSSKKVETLLNYLSHKLWSTLSVEEQIETLHSLSEIVTCHMSIREQMEVIKIIDPLATISPEDKEFVLDVSSLNDTKMKRILEFIRTHKSSLPKKSLNFKKTKQINNLFTEKSNSRSKRKQRQRTCVDEDIRQKRKLALHGQKEIRSGLFVYEKVIKKLSNPLEEDEDVNILE